MHLKAQACCCEVGTSEFLGSTGVSSECYAHMDTVLKGGAVSPPIPLHQPHFLHFECKLSEGKGLYFIHCCS